ncbi:hypothetical protein ACL03H_01860 [Saccharopolyspora sp. MS10]|uniref:hypothetical protein n=1 Tax=Saccharopolyspora sp. MS10 TaxID=3385973 RepID=UPI0039A16448
MALRESGWPSLRSRRIAETQRTRLVRETSPEVEGAVPRRESFSLPSADGSFRFAAVIAFTVRSGEAEPDDPAVLDLARTGIARRAEAVSTRFRLTEENRVKGELTTALWSWEALAGCSVRGRCVSIDTDVELVEQIAEFEKWERRRSVLAWQARQRKEQEERMRSLVVDPIGATARWFLDNQDKPRDVVAVAGEFQKLRSLLLPEEQADSPGALVDDLLDNLSEEAHRDHLIRTLRKWFTHFGRDDLGARLPGSGG